MNTEQKAIARGVIMEWLTARELKKEDFGRMLGLGRTSGYIRINNPGSLTVDELRMMHLEDQDIIKIVGGER